MATIGLDKLYYAKIMEDSDGNETYDTPVPLAKAMSAELSVELAEATLYADDGASEVVKEFQSGTLTLGIDDIGTAVAEDLTGATIDKNKVLVSASGRSTARCNRFSCKESERQVSLLLALQSEVWHSCN